MAEAKTQHLRWAYRWGALLLLAVVLAAGLVALPKGQASGQIIGRSPGAARIQPAAAPLHTLSLPLSAGHGAVLAFTPYAQLVPADAPKIYASSAYLMDPVTGEVFYSDNALDEVPMASTTKIMTAVVAMTFGKPDQKITIGQDAIKEQNGENSVADLTPGDVLTLKDLLYALLLPSGDDAAVAIADGVAGSQDNFVRMMNLEAALLGLDHTHYTNVHGLDAPGHYTTVGDLARVGRIAMQNFPLFAQIVKTPTYVVRTALHGQYTWHTTNELMTPVHDYQGAIGIKTGHTGNAGYCLVFAATRSGATLIGVLLGEQDQSGEQRFYDATALLNWGFAREKTITNVMNAIAGKP
ncbi:MAG TPA: D-alanyl-D-alanine carboxypeptidase family protein [Ktedonobacterales bacterium]|nr:D-alanyl-D-alanine carboxypeptidase family protein [Ktedonobacterales bacterium]